MSSPRLPPRRIVAVAIGLASAVFGYSAYWFHAAGLVRDSVVTWAEERRSLGWQVDYSGLAINGFPTHITATFRQPAITSPHGLGWRGETLTARASVFDLRHLHLSAPGHHDLTLGAWTASADAGDLHGEVGFDAAGRVHEGHFGGSAIRFASAGFAETTVEALDVSLMARDQSPTADHQTATLHFTAAATGISLPAMPELVLDRRVAMAEIDGRVLGPFPAGPPLDALREWSDNGGTVAIDRLALEWAPMALDANGTFAFDPRMQPLAAFSAHVRGYGALMDRLARNGVVEPGAAAAAKLFLSMMAKPDSQGRAAIPVPITLQDGQLSLGPAMIATFPPIPWPAHPPHPASPG
ncbi:MAG: DUF2125 domain-containing protein [Magnetospirillum sp.]|nr:DUF2125 domain-containing protein [Magnetospirillum sp.]